MQWLFYPTLEPEVMGSTLTMGSVPTRWNSSQYRFITPDHMFHSSPHPGNRTLELLKYSILEYNDTSNENTNGGQKIIVGVKMEDNSNIFQFIVSYINIFTAGFS